MLRATRRLLDLRHEPDAPWDLRWALRRVIVKLGGPDDVPPLLEWFLEVPDEAGLLGPVMAHGRAEDAARLYDACAAGGALREGVDPLVLHALGYLGYEPARALLLRYLTGATHAENEAAVLGLLHLPLGDAGPRVREQILACRGKALFPEFLPALASRTGDPELLPALFEMGQYASTDCNGGLVFGIALYGDPGREYFRRLIDDPHWEAAGGATGTGTYAWYGMRALDLTCAELVARLLEAGRRGAGARPDPTLLKHRAAFAISMIEARAGGGGRSFVRQVDERPLEPVEPLFRTAFAWTTPLRDDSLAGAIREWFGPQDPLCAKVHRVENELRDALTDELLEAEGR
ncbi:MAG TPA: hypothetical protein VFS43_38515 [Polyangiaceae bacterium]|nr:hypothetical protein [Polyangiaceae bacterium]